MHSRKRFRSITAFALAAMLGLSLLSSAASAGEVQNTTDGASRMSDYVKAMQPGWNLGNTLDATGDDETSWGNPRVTKELIEHIAAEGYNSIRIPVTWGQHMGEAPDYSIDEDYMDRVQEVVGWALDADLYVMINMHHDSWQWISYMESNHDEVLAKYRAAWTQISDRFKNHSQKLMFEAINEPRFTDGGTTDKDKQYEMLKELLVSFHQIVRASGGENSTRPLVIPTRETSPAQEDLEVLYQTIQEFNDPNLIATVHFYGFWPFSVNIAGHYKLEQETMDDMITTFDHVHTTLVSKGIPVILGEYGLLGFDKNTSVIEQGEKLKFFENLMHVLKERHITHMLWDNGQHLKRTELAWSDPELINIMKAGWEQRASTAETDLVYLKLGEEVKDVEVELNLNGNELTGLYQGAAKLEQGIDYDLTGSKLTLKASLLTQLTRAGHLGQNAILSAKFSYGPDWKLKVVAYELPQLGDASGTVDSFAIPTHFNGNRLATMEAIYNDGSFAGPQNWTSYKEYGYTFTPDFMKNQIVISENFFKETDDREVTLKFHFWGGDIVSYKITKSGTQVTGKVVTD